MNKVELKFIDKALQRGGIYLFKSSDALKFIEECQNQKINILGIDAFFITENQTIPSSENSIDISTRPFEFNDYAILKQFLLNKNETLYFEIVCSI